MHIPCDDGDHIVIHRQCQDVFSTSKDSSEELDSPWPARFRKMRELQAEATRKQRALEARNERIRRECGEDYLDSGGWGDDVHSCCVSDGSSDRASSSSSYAPATLSPYAPATLSRKHKLCETDGPITNDWFPGAGERPLTTSSGELDRAPVLDSHNASSSHNAASSAQPAAPRAAAAVPITMGLTQEDIQVLLQRRLQASLIR